MLIEFATLDPKGAWNRHNPIIKNHMAANRCRIESPWIAHTISAAIEDIGHHANGSSLARIMSAVNSRFTSYARRDNASL